MATPHEPGLRDLAGWMAQTLGPDSGFLRLAIIYGTAISLLSLATPISVQLLINSVANTALPTPLFTLAAILFTLLLVAGILSAFRVQLMSFFERRLFARLVAEVTLRAVHAQNPFFLDARRGDLFNRFFDMMTVQKALPSLLIGGFTIVLQGAVGLVVTSFYHPFFLAFNGVLLAILFVIWQIWSRRAIATAISKSHAKHATAHWLASVGGSNGFYKSSRHLDFAMDRSEALTARYVRTHEAHFRYTFRQTLCLLFTYALASAALLALGGWLILLGELSIGQLVAAELILSGVFYGVSQLGSYLETFYDLAAGLEELSLFWDIPQETITVRPAPDLADGTILLREVIHGRHHLDFSVASGEQLAVLADPGVDRSLAVLLKRLEVPDRGLVLVGGADIAEFDMYRLRSDIVVLDRPTIVEMTVREYLGLASPGANTGSMMDAIETVGLTGRIGLLPNGLDTALSNSGWPLSVGDMMALKLAAALITRPRVLMLSALYDLLPPSFTDAALAALRSAGTTVLQFTRRPEAMTRDGWLYIGSSAQHRAATRDGLAGFAGQGGANAVQA